MIVTQLTELIGKTPMLEVSGLPSQVGRIVLKLEYFNPGGSVKDRIALNMIIEAEKQGLLKPGATIIEPTSGNTGVGIAWVGIAKGYKVILTMPETMSEERRSLLKAYGAELILTPGKDGMKGAIAKAEELRANTPGAIILGQFVNPANPTAHFETTGEEIWADTNGDVDCLVAGVGTGGTISGTGHALKNHKVTVHVVAVEPATSAVLSGNAPGAHKIQGIGAGFIPATYDAKYVDEIMPISSEEAIEATQLLAKRYGLLVGISSGAAFAAAYRLAQKKEWAKKMIVAIMPDTGTRYLSMGIF